MIKKQNNLTSFADHLNDEYGKKGTATREAFEKGFETFKLRAMLQEFSKKKD